MARFGGGKKSRSGKKKALYTRVKGRQNAKRKPVLPKKGVTQSSYEAGFFDFLKVFWKNNTRMELCSLTKQVANAWDALLPKPKLSKRRVLRDYSKEFKMLQEEAKMKQMEEEEFNKMKQESMERKRRDEKSEEDTGTETEASRSNFDESGESIRDSRSRSGMDEDESHESRSERNRDRTDDESMSEKNSESHNDTGSENKSEDNKRNESRRNKRKRKGRKYNSYEEYQKAHGKKFKSEKNDDGNRGEKNHDANEDSNQERQVENSEMIPKDGIFFPMREETSFDRIVRNDYDDQNEMLRNLKLHGFSHDPDDPDNDDSRRVQSVDSFSSPTSVPKFPSQSKSNSGKLSNPTDTLHVKNLVVGIRQPELQEIFKIFLKDIVLIRVLDNKFNGEAVVEFKNAESAERVWRQMNGVEYKRLPLVLEFANKEDLLY